MIDLLPVASTGLLEQLFPRLSYFASIYPLDDKQGTCVPGRSTNHGAISTNAGLQDASVARIRILSFLRICSNLAPFSSRGQAKQQKCTHLLICQAVVHGVVHRDRVVLANHFHYASVGVNLLKGNVQRVAAKNCPPDARYPRELVVRKISEHPQPRHAGGEGKSAKMPQGPRPTAASQRRSLALVLTTWQHA